MNSRITALIRNSRKAFLEAEQKNGSCLLDNKLKLFTQEIGGKRYRISQGTCLDGGI